MNTTAPTVKMTRAQFWARFDAENEQPNQKELHWQLHREYYAQFVTEHIKRIIIWSIGIVNLMNSKDQHFNDIPLSNWDRLYGGVDCHKFGALGVAHLIKAANETISASTMICIVKEAARQIVEEETAKNKV